MYDKGSDVASLQKLSPASCHSFQKEEPPAVAADDSTCQPTAAKTPSPRSAPPGERKPRGDSAPPHREHVGRTEPGSPKQLRFLSPALPPPRRPSFALPRPQCDEQSSENRTPLRQKGTAVCLQPLIPIQIAFPASLPQGRLGANCVCMGKAGVYFRK